MFLAYEKCVFIVAAYTRESDGLNERGIKETHAISPGARRGLEKRKGYGEYDKGYKEGLLEEGNGWLAGSAGAVSFGAY